ncbi:MAG: CBS domain-containing protein [Nitrososphaerota archaeon]|nr:CBS domain-containing protein [Nitrososphaerota archaeon]MDG6922736.1 CBS domain-containing protein [Nitrososphaerota archaeon]
MNSIVSLGKVKENKWYPPREGRGQVMYMIEFGSEVQVFHSGLLRSEKRSKQLETSCHSTNRACLNRDHEISRMFLPFCRRHLSGVTELISQQKVSKLGADTWPFEENISELMTKEVITADPEDDVRLLSSRMVIFNIGGLVIKDDNSRVVGLVTERDLVKRIA